MSEVPVYGGIGSSPKVPKGLHWTAEHTGFLKYSTWRGVPFFKFKVYDLRIHTVEFNAFVKSQLALRIQLEGLMCCKFVHVTFKSVRFFELPA